MKHKISLILILALLSTTFAWAQTTSAYYEVPEGAFFAGMTENGSAADKTFYLPYNYGQKYIFTSTEDGTWTSGNGSLPDKKEYSYSNRTMKDSCHTPLLAVEGKVGYQYGASGESYDESLYFHIGDSVMHYMTPARIYDETGNISQKAIDNYYTKTRDTIGVFFNTDVMYIDSISIPISFGTSTGYSLDAMFPSGATVYAKIYQATQTEGGKSGNKFDRNSTPLRTIELTQECFKKHPSTKYRGVLTATVGEQPLAITGPFVIELTNMKKAGCKFYIYAAKGRSGSNKWGYYVNGTTMTYPGDYTPAISVRAMFPALYTEQSLDVKIPAVGSSKAQTNRPSRKVYANWKYISKTNGWEAATATSGLGISVAFNESSNDWVKWLFTMSANTTPNVREGYVTFKFRGKELKFHLIQPPVIESVSISESELSLKATKTAILTAEVLPEDRNTINWVSEDETIATVDATGKVTAVGVGTTKIKAVSLDPDKYAECTVTVEPLLIETNVPKTKLTAPQLGGDVCFDEKTATEQLKIALYGKEFKKSEWTLTKPDWVKTEQFAASETTKNILFKFSVATMTPEERNGEIKISAYGYEFTYTITQAGAGKLTANHDFRTFVVGPKGGNARAVDENDEITYANSVRVYANIPTKDNVKGGWYSTTHICNFEMSNNQDDKGYYKLILPIKIEGENNTGVDRLDSFRVYLPGCDTIKFYVRQEAKARVWQRFASSYTAMEVGNKGGKAHFSGYTETELTYISNTPIETDEVAITCADWIEASPIINTNKDTVRITFTIGEYLGMEPRTDTMTITIQGSEFRMPLIQKVFGIEWSLTGGGSELAIPVEGGKTTYLNIFGTEPYREGLLQITTPEGVSITDKSVTTLSTGRQRTSCKFKKEGSVTEDWQDTIFLALDTINQEAGFEYHYKDTIIITQLAPVPEPTHTREGSVGNYGTLCFPYTPTQEVTGADFYKVLWFNEPAMDLVLEKITSQPEAGVPYIFQYTADQMVWTYNNAETPVDISATGVNGLHGVASEEGYTVSESDVTAGTYLLSNNKIVKAAATSHAAQYRAYLKLNEVSTEAPVGPVTAPRIHMTVPGNGTPTNLNGLNGNVKATKVLRDGQLIIIRDGKTYNAQGIEL